MSSSIDRAIQRIADIYLATEPGSDGKCHRTREDLIYWIEETGLAAVAETAISQACERGYLEPGSEEQASWDFGPGPVSWVDDTLYATDKLWQLLDGDEAGGATDAKTGKAWDTCRLLMKYAPNIDNKTLAKRMKAEHHVDMSPERWMRFRQNHRKKLQQLTAEAQPTRTY